MRIRIRILPFTLCGSESATLLLRHINDIEKHIVNKHLKKFFPANNICESGSDNIRITLQDPDRDRHSGPANPDPTDPDRYQNDADLQHRLVGNASF